MSIEKNKAIIRRYYEEVLNQGDINALRDIAVSDYVENDPLPGQTTGLAGLRERVEMLRGALNPHFTIEDMVAEVDKVVVRWTQHGMQVREFLGLPPTGKQFTISGIDIHGLRDAE
jgi:predicted ester cyclase